MKRRRWFRVIYPSVSPHFPVEQKISLPGGLERCPPLMTISGDIGRSERSPVLFWGPLICLRGPTSTLVSQESRLYRATSFSALRFDQASGSGHTRGSR